MLKKKNPLEIPNVSDNPIGYFPTPHPPLLPKASLKINWEFMLLLAM